MIIYNTVDTRTGIMYWALHPIAVGWYNKFRLLCSWADRGKYYPSTYGICFSEDEFSSIEEGIQWLLEGE